MRDSRRPLPLAASLLILATLAGCNDMAGSATTPPATDTAGTASNTPSTPTVPDAGATATSLVTTWEFETVVFVDAEGNTESSAWGELRFNADGTYVQSMHIGQFLNAEEGTYRLEGANTVHLTPQSGEPRMLTYGVTGDRLSLTSDTPTLKTMYGLVRAEQ